MTDTLTLTLAWVAGTALTAAALLVLVRIVRGPTMLDRVIATDVLVAVIVCAVGVEAAVFRHGTTLPVLLTVSLFAFISAVSVARFIVPDTDEARR
jgi:multicomponent Na+:H+ antiporter subunit F